jgi:hypothetical protein
MFVAMLDASALFHPRSSSRFSALCRALFGKREQPRDLMAKALSQYRPAPWYGKILHMRPKLPSGSSGARFEWSQIAPHGFATYDLPAEMLAEPNVQRVATILAAELVQAPCATSE